MTEKQYFFRKLSKLLQVGIFFATCESRLESASERNQKNNFQTDSKDSVSSITVQSFCENPEYNPILSCSDLQQKLIEGAKNQEEPYLFKDSFQVCFAGIKCEEGFLLVGPMSLELLSHVELFQYCKRYQIKTDSISRLKHFPFAKMLDIVELVAWYVKNRAYEDEELVLKNHIAKDTTREEKQEKVLFELKESEEEMYHHTYEEERKLLSCVREGRVKEALTSTRNMDADLGRLSQKELNHCRNAAIVGITLCSRAAIEGGVSPSVVYRLSDYYIQKCDKCNDMGQILEYRNHAVEELTTRVQNRLQKQKTSNYVERCKDYIDRHYREKIYLDEIADTFGISSSYLSRMFREQTKMRFQDYIVQVRIEHAANLLIYSEESIAGIAEYVNFPSQSYMGTVFKAYKHMTPKEYRDRFKPGEFISK